MTDDSTASNDIKPLRFIDEQEFEQTCELPAEQAIDAFWAFIAERRGEGNQAFTIEDPAEHAGLTFDYDWNSIARYKRFYKDDGVTLDLSLIHI